MLKTLADHLTSVPNDAVVKITGHLEMPITAPFVESDAELQPGGVFIARKGRSVDGHGFIPRAIERGAAAIVGELDLQHLPVPYIQVRDAKAVIGWLAASYHDFPSRKLIVIGVTGTDGKTTTSTLIHSVLKQATNHKAGLISTIAADFGDTTADTGLHVTTPHAPAVQQYLARMVDVGLTHVVLEMTSHGLAQGRLNGVDIDIAVLTNITHEHLDYHGMWENYRDAKALMFRMLTTSYRKPDVPKISILNRDDPSFDYFAAIPADQVISYGIHHPEAHYRAAEIEFLPDVTRFKIFSLPLDLKLVGEFNIYNALAAFATTHRMGHTMYLKSGLENITEISGRMERIYEGQNFMAMVDFAHTPNALEKALSAAKTMLAPGKKLIAVFGSAGLRDVQKRRMMAETSAQLADMTILTAEDPRTESLDDILEMMAQGCISRGGVEGQTFIRVPDRGEALYRACQMAQPGDIVMACGKGHEQSMCFGTIEYPWDDRAAMRAALRGTPLKTLPTAKDNG